MVTRPVRPLGVLIKAVFYLLLRSRPLCLLGILLFSLGSFFFWHFALWVVYGTASYIGEILHFILFWDFEVYFIRARGYAPTAAAAMRNAALFWRMISYGFLEL